jgi:DNA-binding winged helix-turn-helix (wHTH) protein
MRFGPFQLFPTARVLEKDGCPVALGSRALDILIVLAERAGEVVNHKELLSRVWRGLIVSPSNLRVHVNALRRTLSGSARETRYIVNVTGQGYCFVAPIQRREESARDSLAPLVPDAAADALELPSALACLVRRSDAVRAIAADLLKGRFVTVVGPGGIGNTTVAVAAAHSLLAEIESDVRFALRPDSPFQRKARWSRSRWSRSRWKARIPD